MSKAINSFSWFLSLVAVAMIYIGHVGYGVFILVVAAFCWIYKISLEYVLEKNKANGGR